MTPDKDNPTEIDARNKCLEMYKNFITISVYWFRITHHFQLKQFTIISITIHAAPY